MKRGPSMLLRDDLLEIVVKTQTALARQAGALTDADTALREILQALKDKGIAVVPFYDDHGNRAA